MIETRSGDVVLVYKPNLISHLILRTMAVFQRDPVRYSHCLMVVGGDVCVEAGLTVALCSLEKTLAKSRHYSILRYSGGTNENLARYLMHHLGERYGFMRLFLQFLNQVFQTRRFTNFLQSRIPMFNICSSLVAEAFDLEYGARINDTWWASVDPDDFDDDAALKPDRWTLVGEKI